MTIAIIKKTLNAKKVSHVMMLAKMEQLEHEAKQELLAAHNQKCHDHRFMMSWELKFAESELELRATIEVHDEEFDYEFDRSY